MSNNMSKGEILDFYLLLRRTGEIMAKARRKELSQYGITPEQAAVLHIIYDLGGEAKGTEISLWLFRRRHSVHTLLGRMEKGGFLKKIKDPRRKNGVLIILTDRGKELYQLLSERKLIGRILTALSTDECERLKESLKRLLEKGRAEIGVEDSLPLRPPVPDLEDADGPS